MEGITTETPAVTPAAEGNIVLSPEFEAAHVSGEVEQSEVSDIDGEVTEPQIDGQPRKLTANERIQQEISRRKELENKLQQFEQRTAQLEQQFQAKQTPDYVEITPQVKSQINATLAALEQSRVEAELDGDYLKATEFFNQRDEILRGLQENNRRRETALQQQQAFGKEQQTQAAINERAEFFRQVNNIPMEQWTAANQYFLNLCNTNPVVMRQFREIADYNGPMAAVDFAVRCVQDGIKDVSHATQQRIDAKTNLVGGTTMNATDITVNSWDDLMNLPSNKINGFAKSNPAAFEKLKNSRFK